jgi:hypothetical protein
MNADKPTPQPAMAMSKFLEYSNPRNARKVLMKLYFLADPVILSREDREEVFLLYCLFENCEEKSPD